MVVSECDANAVIIPGGQKNFPRAAQRNGKGLLTTTVGGVGAPCTQALLNENNAAVSLMQGVRVKVLRLHTQRPHTDPFSHRLPEHNTNININ